MHNLHKSYNLEHGPMMVKDIQCSGTEKKLSDCVVIFIDHENDTCYHNSLFSLRCVDG